MMIDNYIYSHNHLYFPKIWITWVRFNYKPFQEVCTYSRNDLFISIINDAMLKLQ